MAFSSVTILFSKNGDAAESGWRQDIAVSDVIVCSLSSTLGVSTYRWRLIGRPEGSGAGGGGPEPIALGNTSWCSFTADVHGTYIVECLVNGGAPDATILTGGCAILESITAPGGLPLRLLGPNETDEDISDPTVNQGQDKMLNRWLRLIEAGGVGGGAVLSTDYNLGTSAADQTLTLTDTNGGPLIIDAQGIGGSFTGTSALEILVPAGTWNNVGLSAYWSGGLELGPDNILIGHVGYPATASDVDGVAIGGNSSCGSDGTAMGFAAKAGLIGAAFGYDAQATGNYSIAILEATASGIASISIGPSSTAAGDYDSVIGHGYTDGVGTDNILITSGGSITSNTVGQNTACGAFSTITASDYAVAINGHVTASDYAIAIGQDSYVLSGSYDAVAIHGVVYDSAQGAVAIEGVVSSGAAESVTIHGNIGAGSNYGIAIEGNVGAGVYAAIALGVGSENDYSSGLACGVFATTTKDNQVVFGDNTGTHAGGVTVSAIHEFIVRGYNAGVIDTLNVTDAPANDYQTGLSIPYRFSGGAVAGEPVYAQLVPPTGSLLLYIPGPPA
jgi:hypothetical protein